MWCSASWEAPHRTQRTLSPVCDAASNWRSQNTVQITKRVGRTLRSHAGATIKMRAEYWRHACLLSNAQKSANDPTFLGRAPADIWPNAPFRDLSRNVVGCTGAAEHNFFHCKGECDNTNGVRAMPGVFVGYGI